MSGSFLDTNVPLYAFNLSDHRQPAAAKLPGSRCAISVQCLNEFASVARRKSKLPWDKIATALEIVAQHSATIVPVTFELHRLGLRVAERTSFPSTTA